MTVKSGARGPIKGQFKCAIGPAGLSLTQGKKAPLVIPVGSSAHYLGKNKFSVRLADSLLEITVVKFGSYVHRLARDLAAFVGGSGTLPTPQNYGLPWYLYVVSALPIGIPILTMGGAIPGAIGFGLASACFGIAQKEEWPIAGRILASLALSMVAYVATFMLLAAIAGRGAVGH
ncbi:MAG: hypothetical protein K8T25_18955 [Planctomycetia bacterium]|nr:hypothetical protein [Planctomycetia bacterium]